MPRWASRILLEVTAVRPPERVQDISHADIHAEGVVGDTHPELSQPCRDDEQSARIYFADLWDSLNAKPKPHYARTKDGTRTIAYYESFPWADIQETHPYRGKPWYVHGNPWVWPSEFRRIKCDG